MSAGLATRDAETVRKVLTEAIEPKVEALLVAEQDRLSDEEFEQILDKMAELAAEALPPDWQGLSDYAVSREGIYEDHP